MVGHAAAITAPDAGDFKAMVFACELSGNETIVTCSIVQMGKDFEVAIDEAVPFDPESGDLVRA